MDIKRMLFRIITSSYWRKSYFLHSPICNIMPSKMWLKCKYKMIMGKDLNLNNPKTFNEKLQWLKVHDHNPLYTTLVDKYAVRDYIKEELGEEYLIPIVGGPWTNAEDIDFGKLPNQFVLKCTHDSGSIVICRDKETFDIEAAVKKLNKALKNNYYYSGREWPYKNVKPQIIAEKYMESAGKTVPEDYKVYCFNGIPKYIVVFHNRFNDSKELSETVYDTNWEPQGISLDSHFKVSNEVEPKPECLPVMLEAAEKLSKGMVQSRIDFYIVDDMLKFGEITLYTASGMQPMIPETLDEVLGKEIHLNIRGGVKLSDEKNLIWSVCNDYEGIEEYKIFCFNGVCQVVLVCSGLAHGAGRINDYCDKDLNRLPFTSVYPNSERELRKPEELPEMVAIAEKLSGNVAQVRVDLYLIDGKIYFGELTLYHNSGFGRFEPEEWDKKLGKMIQLPESPAMRKRK